MLCDYNHLILMTPSPKFFDSGNYAALLPLRGAGFSSKTPHLCSWCRNVLLDKYDCSLPCSRKSALEIICSQFNSTHLKHIHVFQAVPWFQGFREKFFIRFLPLVQETPHVEMYCTNHWTSLCGTGKRYIR